MIICANCGAEVDENLKYCPSCGSVIKQIPSNIPPQTQYTPQPMQQPAAEQCRTCSGSYEQPAPFYPPLHRRGSVLGSYERPAPGSQYAPMGAWAYFGWTLLLTCIPIVSFILTIVFSANSSNINRRSFARSILIFDIIGITIFLIFLLAGVSFTEMLFDLLYDLM